MSCFFKLSQSLITVTVDVLTHSFVAQLENSVIFEFKGAIFSQRLMFSYAPKQNVWLDNKHK